MEFFIFLLPTLRSNIIPNQLFIPMLPNGVYSELFYSDYTSESTEPRNEHDPYPFQFL